MYVKRLRAISIDSCVFSSKGVCLRNDVRVIAHAWDPVDVVTAGVEVVSSHHTIEPPRLSPFGWKRYDEKNEFCCCDFKIEAVWKLSDR